jgi:hypothetical protein
MGREKQQSAFRIASSDIPITKYSVGRNIPVQKQADSRDIDIPV